MPRIKLKKLFLKCTNDDQDRTIEVTEPRNIYLNSTGTKAWSMFGKLGSEMCLFQYNSEDIIEKLRVEMSNL